MTDFSNTGALLDERSMAQSEMGMLFGDLVSGSTKRCVLFRNAILREFGRPRETAGRSPEREFMDAVLQVLQPPRNRGDMIGDVRGHVANIVTEANKSTRASDQMAQQEHILQATRHAHSALRLLFQFEPANAPKPVVKRADPRKSPDLGTPASLEMQQLVADTVIAAQVDEKTAALGFLTEGAKLMKDGHLTPLDIAAACHGQYAALVPADGPQCTLGHLVTWSQTMGSAIRSHTTALHSAAQLRRGITTITFEDPEHATAAPGAIINHPARRIDLQETALSSYRAAIGSINALVQTTLVDCAAANLPVHIQVGILGRPVSALINRVELATTASRVAHVKAPRPTQLLSGIATRPSNMPRVVLTR